MLRAPDRASRRVRSSRGSAGRCQKGSSADPWTSILKKKRSKRYFDKTRHRNQDSWNDAVPLEGLSILLRKDSKDSRVLLSLSYNSLLPPADPFPISNKALEVLRPMKGTV